MIYFSTKDGKHVVVLDPANVAQLKSGDSLMTPDGIVIMSFTPDALWLSGELEKVFSGEEKVLTPVKLKELLHEGLAREKKAFSESIHLAGASQSSAMAGRGDAPIEDDQIVWSPEAPIIPIPQSPLTEAEIEMFPKAPSESSAQKETTDVPDSPQPADDADPTAPL